MLSHIRKYFAAILPDAVGPMHRLYNGLQRGKRHKSVKRVFSAFPQWGKESSFNKWNSYPMTLGQKTLILVNLFSTDAGQRDKDLKRKI